VASLEFQGITGIAYVQITGGTHDAPNLRRIPGQGNPVITSKASQLQEVIEAAPELINRIISLVERATMLLDDANQENFAAAMANINTISASVAEGSGDIRTLLSDSAGTILELRATAVEARALFGEIRGSVELITSDARGAIGAINDLAKGITGEVGGVGPQAKTALKALEDAANSLGRSQDQLSELIGENRESITNFTSSGLYEFTQLLAEARGLVTGLSRISGQIERDPARFLFGDAQQGVGVR
jgi:phospholipid/cholesterol/gamma-HCH transport system substrate-binding protein